ncbi:MAG: lycopene cyclase domain-containing protein [Candidatus Phosphoribacter sp.]
MVEVPEYTVLAVASVLGVLLAERFWWRTGLLRTAQFWVAMGIVFFFQTLVDGWLTKLRAPIVIYNPAHLTGIRVPFDIPVEDYAFGFSMVSLTLVAWVRLGRRHESPAPERSR